MDEDTCPICGAQSSREYRRNMRPRMLRCPSCGTLWQPVDRASAPDAGKYAAEYYEAWGHLSQALSVKLATFDGYLRTMEKRVPPGRLLDVGCALGFLLEAAQLRGWVPYGVELSPHAARVAGERFGAERIHKGSLEGASFPEESFRAITLTDVLEHLPEPMASLRRCHELLEPGGCILVVTPRVGSLSQRLMGAGWFQIKEEHLQLLTRRALRLAVEAAGFRVVRTSNPAKTLSLDYLAHHFRAYPRAVVTPVLNVLERLAGPLAGKGFRVGTGEQLVVAEKVHAR